MVEFNLSYILVSLYIMLCLLAGFQVSRILYYRHNRASFQFGFLITCFIWTTLRVIYFLVLYPPLVEDVNCWLYDVIFLGPVVVQFVTFCLLIIFYAYWVHKQEWESKYKFRFVACSVVMNLVFVVLLLVFIGFDCSDSDDTDATLNLMIQLQEILSGFIFFLLTVVLTWYGWRLYQQTNGSASNAQFIRVKQRANSTRQIIAITTVIVLIFLTRAIHDFLSIDPIYRQVLNRPLRAFEFMCYLFWEITPTLMVLVYFRRIPKTTYGRSQTSVIHAATLVNSGSAFRGRDTPQQKQGAQLFEDLHRYDSDEERFFRPLSWTPVFATPTASLHSSASGEHVGAALLTQYGKNQPVRNNSFKTPLIPHREDTD